MIGPKLPPSHERVQWVESSNPAASNGQAHGAVPQASLVSITDLPFMVKADMGAGLQNLGNSCYMNSVLQCLAYLPPLTNAVQQGWLHGFACACPVKLKGGVCAACLVEQQLLSQLRSPNCRAVRPDALQSRLHTFSKSFVRGRQEDAHEFLLGVLDAVERDSRRGVVALGHPKSTRTLVEQFFCGRLQSQVRCLECGHCSHTYEAITGLSLDLHRAGSVEDSLRQYMAAELLDGANRYKCDKCKRLVRAHKSLGVHDEPNVLVVHLKRFDALSFSAKLCKHIKFKSTLTLPSAAHTNGAPSDNPPADGNGHAVQSPAHVKGNGNHAAHGPRSGPSNGAAAAGNGVQAQRPYYMLTGVVVHSGGSVHSGHYYAYVRNSAGRWFCANDSSVYQVSLDEVLQQQAYLLFYSRTALKPLSPLPQEPAPAPATTAITTSTTTTGVPARQVPIGPERPSHLQSRPGTFPQGMAAAGATALSNASSSSTFSAQNGTTAHAQASHAALDVPHQSTPSYTASGGSWSTVQNCGSHASTKPFPATSTTTVTGSSGHVPRVILMPKKLAPATPQVTHRAVKHETQHQPQQKQASEPVAAARSHGLARKRDRPEPDAKQQESGQIQQQGGQDQVEVKRDTQGGPKRIARLSDADEQKPQALGDVMHRACDQIMNALRATPGFLDDVRAWCTGNKQDGVGFHALMGQDKRQGRAAIVRKRLGSLPGQKGNLIEEWEHKLRDAVRDQHGAGDKSAKQ